MLYLSGCHNQRLAVYAQSHPVGLMLQPGNGYRGAIPTYRWWAADNGCFAQGEAFDGERWIRWLETLPRAGCLFAVAPDVVGDSEATLARSRPWLRRIRELGFPAAYAAQDGILDAPWDEFDALFIGGSTEWKLSPAASRIVNSARIHRKHVHMGRVNSLRRLQAASLMGCHSADGTFLAFRARIGGGEGNVAEWLETLEREPFLPFAGLH